MQKIKTPLPIAREELQFTFNEIEELLKTILGLSNDQGILLTKGFVHQAVKEKYKIRLNRLAIQMLEDYELVQTQLKEIEVFKDESKSADELFTTREDKRKELLLEKYSYQFEKIDYTEQVSDLTFDVNYFTLYNKLFINAE